MKLNPFLEAYNRVKFDGEGNIVDAVLRDHRGPYEFAKLYTDYVNNWITKINKSENIIVGYILKNLEAGADTIYINKVDIEGVSTSSFYKSIDKLVEVKLIAKTDKKYVYWINPYYVFKGSRAEYIKGKFNIKDNEWEKYKKMEKIPTDELIRNFEARKGDGGNISPEWIKDKQNKFEDLELSKNKKDE